VGIGVALEVAEEFAGVGLRAGVGAKAGWVVGVGGIVIVVVVAGSRNGRFAL
jgi:hypothetical protein